MSWLGNGFREESKALADAYAQMYAPQEEQQEEEKVEKEELSEERYKKQRNINAYPARMRAALLNANSKDRDAAFEKYDRENPREKKAVAEATYPCDFKDGSGVAKRKTDRPKQDDQEKDAAGRRKTVDEAKDPIKYALEADKRLMKLHTKDKPAPKGYEKKEEQDILAAMKDAYEMIYEKKKSGSDKCGEGTYWDKEEKKCKSKKKSGGGGRAIFYGGHSHGHDDEEGESEGGSDGAAAGEAAGGGGGE